MFMNHVAGSKCLLEIDAILKIHEVPYFLMQGTALGAYRDQGFVPTERDIDIGILQEYLPLGKAYSLLHTLMASGFDVECFRMPFTCPRTLVAFKEYDGHVVKVDLVGLTRWKDLRFTATPVRSYVEEPYCLVHEAKLLEPPYRQTVELWGTYFNIPGDIERYLFCEYGPNWRTPKEDHISRTRVYNFIEREGIPHDYLERHAEHQPTPRRVEGTL